MGRFDLVLASASPRRLELLRGLGLSPLVRPPRIDERERRGEAMQQCVLRLAREKGRAVVRTLDRSARPAVVLAADTVVALEGRALGKPRDADDARAMLAALSGRDHEVWTGVFLHRTDDASEASGADTTRVFFRRYDEDTIRRYVDTGEPLDKAGAYGIQGGGAKFAERLEGSWSNVVGLPLERLPGWLAELGLSLEDFGDGNRN